MELFVSRKVARDRRPGPKEARAADDRPLSVADLAAPRAVKVPSWFTAAAALSVARLKGVEHLLVLERHMLAGTVSVRALVEAPANTPVARLMVPGSTTIRPETPAEQAWNVMVAEDLECLPVARGPLLVGMIARNDLAAAARRARASG